MTDGPTIDGSVSDEVVGESPDSDGLEPRAVDRALAAWVAALNAPEDAEALSGAVAPDVAVERWGYGERSGEVVERFDGADAVHRWLRRQHPGLVTFSVDGRPDAPDAAGVWHARYRYVGDPYDGGGVWRVRIDDGAHIVWLAHVPSESTPGR